MAITGEERDAIATRVEASIRSTLERGRWNADELMKDFRVDVSDGRATLLVVDGGADPVAKAVKLLTSGRAKPKADYAKIRAEAEAVGRMNDAQAAVQRKLGLRA